MEKFLERRIAAAKHFTHQKDAGMDVKFVPTTFFSA
jgi:hypothetical protein